MIITGLIEHIVATVGNIIEGTINTNYKVIIKVFIEVYFEVIARRNAIFIRSQIASQLGTLWTDKRKYIISFVRAHGTLKIRKLLQPISKASWFNIKG